MSASARRSPPLRAASPPLGSPPEGRPKRSIIATGGDGAAWRATTRHGSGRAAAVALACRPFAPSFDLTDGLCGPVVRAVLPAPTTGGANAEMDAAATRVQTAVRGRTARRMMAAEDED